MKCVPLRRYAAVLCSALLAAAACSSGGSPSRPVRISVATPTVDPPGQHFSMPSDCMLVKDDSKVPGYARNYAESVSQSIR
jgi:hypothetical protein